MDRNIRDITVTGLFAAVICVAAPWSVNIGPVPISLATFAVYLAGAVLGWRRGTAAVAVYLVIGALGLPVFSNFSGGLQKLAGVTGGYLVGYIFAAMLTGLFADRWEKLWAYAVGMLSGTVLLYAFGTAWFSFTTKNPVSYSLGVCVLPFLPGDVLKIAAASVLAVRLRPLARERLIKA